MSLSKLYSYSCSFSPVICFQQSIYFLTEYTYYSDNKQFLCALVFFFYMRPHTFLFTTLFFHSLSKKPDGLMILKKNFHRFYFQKEEKLFLQNCCTTSFKDFSTPIWLPIRRDKKLPRTFRSQSYYIQHINMHSVSIKKITKHEYLYIIFIYQYRRFCDLFRQYRRGYISKINI